MTPCECEQAGWWHRHSCAKTPLLVELCQRLPPWFELWERGSSPGQGDTPVRGGRPTLSASRPCGGGRRSAPLVEVKAIHSNGFNPTQVERSVTLNGVTTTEQYGYEYGLIGGDYQLSRVTLRRRVGMGDWTDVTRAQYAYYEESDAYGASSDLKTGADAAVGRRRLGGDGNHVVSLLPAAVVEFLQFVELVQFFQLVRQR